MKAPSSKDWAGFETGSYKWEHKDRKTGISVHCHFRSDEMDSKAIAARDYPHDSGNGDNSLRDDRKHIERDACYGD
jgi:hypothetical protein